MSPGGLAEDGHVARVASERRDVIVDPSQRGDLVEQRHVARTVEPRVDVVEVAEAECAEPVVHGDDDDVAAQRELGGVEEASRADRERSTVDPHHHRPRRARPRARPGREDVQVEAVLVDGDVDDPTEPARFERLRRARRPRGRVAHARPGLDRLGRPEPALADRRRGERHTPELRDAAFVEPPHAAERELDLDAHAPPRFAGRTTRPGRADGSARSPSTCTGVPLTST